MARTGYQLLGPSPWPVSVAFSVVGLCAAFLIFVCDGGGGPFWGVFSVSFGLCIFVMSNWWGDVVKESTYLGQWSTYVLRLYVWGFRFFIISEIFFFGGLIGSFIFCAVGESSIHGVGFWPPRGVKPLSPWKMAFLNTSILVGSSFTANWAYWCVKCHNLMDTGMDVSLNNPFYKDVNTFFYQKLGLVALAITICLGLVFTCLQALEYYWSSFTFADSIYGSLFFLLTGFHGLHVIFGTVFLVVCWFRLLFFHFSFNHFYFGVWAAVWYWHFVDVVWIFVYSLVYIWSFLGCV